MKPGQYALQLYQGDDFRLPITVENDDGTARDLTNHSFRSQIREKPASDTILVTATVTITDATAGKIELSIDAADTAGLPQTAAWDLEMTDDVGDVQTILAGGVRVGREVTR